MSPDLELFHAISIAAYIRIYIYIYPEQKCYGLKNYTVYKLIMYII